MIKAFKVAKGLAAVAAGCFAWGLVEATRFRVRHVTVPALPPGGSELRILHLSDIHLLPGQQLKLNFLRSLAELEPDLVINTGDNLGAVNSVPHLLQALDPLLHRPGLFVFGTNDYYAPRPVNPFGYLLGKKRKVSRITLPWEGMRAAFIERGWRDANQARHEFKVGPVRIAAAGVDDPSPASLSFSTPTATSSPSPGTPTVDRSAYPTAKP